MNYSIPNRILFSLFVVILTLSAKVVNGQCPTAVSITAPANKFCPGGNVTLTANVTGGSGNFTYLWRNLGNVVAGSGSTLNITTPGFYTVRVTDNTNICSRTSAGFAVSVSPTAGLVISGPLSFCIGNNVLFTVDSAANYTFQWKESGVNIFGSTSSNYTATTSGNYSVEVTDNSLACSLISDTQTVTVYPTTVAGNIAAPSAICAGVTAPALTLTGYTGSIIRWESSLNGTIWSTIANTTDTYNPGTPSQTTQYRAVVQSGTCAAATSNTVTLTVHPLPIATITESASLALCSGGSVTLSNSNGVSYVWRESGAPIGGATSNSLVVNTAGSYTVTVTDGNTCSATTASPSIVTVDPITVPGSVSGGTTVCEGNTSGLLTLSGNTGSILRWESSVNSGATWSTIANTNSTYTSGALANNTLFRAIVQSGACALDSSTSTTVTVDPSTVGGTVSGGTTICEGLTSGTLTLAGHTGNIVRWESSATIGFGSPTTIANTSNTFVSGALTTSTYFRAVVKSGVCNEQNSAETLVTVTNAPVITAQPVAATRCVGTSVTFSVSATGATGYQWRKNSVDIPSANSSTYIISSVSLTDDDDYDVVISNACLPTTTSNTIHLTVNPLPTATITPGGPTTFCSGGSVNLSAPLGHSYQWKKNGINESTSNPYNATTAGNYTVVVTDGNGCIATSSATVVTVNALPDASITQSGPTSFCTGGSVTLSNSNGTSYQWKKNNLDTAVTTSSFVVNTSGDYTVQVTDGNGCVALTAIATTVTVDAPTIPGTVSGGTNICSGNTSGVLTLSGNNGSVIGWVSAVSPFSSWNTIANTNATYTSGALTATTQFKAVVKNGTCATDSSSNTTVNVDAAPIAGSVSGGTTICSGGTSALLTLSGHTGNITKWQSTVSPFNTWSDIVNTSSTYTSGVLTETTRFRAVIGNGACSDVQSTHTEVVVDAPINITVQPTPDTKCVGASVTFSVTATGAVSGYQWKFNGTNIPSANTSTYNIASITALDAGNYTVEVQSTNCSNVLSSAAALTVNSASTPVIQQTVGNDTFCVGQSGTIRTLIGWSGYQWKKDGSNLIGDVNRNLSVTLAGSYEVVVTDANGCNATSAPYIITVNPLPSSAITPGGNTNICAGGSVTLSNAETGTYQWISGGIDILGAQSSSYNATTSGNYTIRVTSAAGCQSTTATPVTVNVSPATVGGGVTAASGTTVCSGSNSPLLTLAGQTGTVTGWESAISPFVTWTPIAHTGTTYTSGALTQTTQFRAVVQSGACSSATSFEEEITVTPPSVGGTVSGSTTICSGGNTGTMTLTGRTGNIVRWESAVSPFVVWTSIANTTTTHAASGLTETTRYRAVVQNTALCAEANSSHAEIVVDNVPTFSLNPSSQGICEGSAVTFSATATSINPITGYQWRRDGINIFGANSNTYSISSVIDGAVGVGGNEADYTIVATNTCGNSAPSTAATLTVHARPTAGLTPSGATTFCQGQSIDLTGSGSTAGYKWLRNGAQISITNPYTASTSGDYKVVAENGFGCVDTTAITTILVNPLPNATITPSGATTFCSGGSVTLSNSNGTSYQWKKNGIDTTTGSSLIVTSSGVYRVVVTDANNCIDSSSTTVTVDAPTVAGNVDGGNVICQGSNSGLLTLTGNTGSVLRWESSINSGTNWSPIVNTNTTYTSGALAQTTAFRAVVQNGTCLIENSDTTITTVDPSTVGGTVSGGTTICEGLTSGTLTLAGHTGNIVRWESSATIGFGSPTTIANTSNTFVSGALTTSTYFRAVVKSGVCNEQNSAETLVTVTNAPVITAQPVAATRCVGTSVTFSVSATGATGYQWRKNSVDIPSANSSTYIISSVSLTDDDDYDVVISNACLPTTTSNTIHLTVNPLPTATITPGGPTTFCSGGSVNLSAPLGHSYQWKKNGINESTSNPYNATTAGNYTVVVTDGNGCIATSSATVVTVNALPDASITQSGPTSFCTGGSVTLSNSNGTSYQWKKNNLDTAVTTSSFVVNTSGDYTVQVTDGNGCVALTAIATTVTVDAPTIPGTVSGGTNICSGNTSGVLTLSGNNGSVIGWVSAVSPFSSWNTIANTNATYTSGALTATTQFKAVVKNGTCASDSSLTTTVTVTPASVGGSVSGGSTPICTGTAPGTLTLSGETGGVISWESAVSPFGTWNTISNVTSTEIPGNLTATTRFRAVVKNGVCPETNSNHQEIIVNPLPTISAQPASTERCIGGNITLSVTATDVVSYQWKKGITNVGTNSNELVLTNLTLTDADDYTVVLTNSCGNTTSAIATLTINSLPTAGSTAGGPTTFCNGDNVSLTASGGTTYQWRKDAVNFSTTNPLVVTTSGSYDVFAISDKGCTSSAAATPIVVTVNSVPSASISPSGTVSFCTGNNQLLTASGGDTYLWKKDGADIDTGAAYTATTAGSYTVVAIQSACSSAVSAATVATITPVGTWLGTVDSDPNNVGNWSCNTIPTASTPVDISTGISPVVSAGKTLVANGITIGAGKTILVNGGTLRIRDGISGTGNINNTSGEVEFFGITGQTIPSGLFTSNTAARIKITNSSTVTLGGPLSITDRLTCEDGIFATGGNLTLISTATGTAFVDAMTPDASITGSVTVQRYIPSSQRRWRFLAAPIAAGNLSLWQDDIFITGTGTGTTIGTTNSNGFDATGNNSPSVFHYDEAATGDLNQGWTAPSNNTMAFTLGKGYRVFIRGDRSLGRLTGAITDQNEVTLDVSGSLNQQTIPMPVFFNSTGILANDGWNLLGNPYAAAYDWGAMYRTGNTGFSGTFYSKIEPNIYIYDPVSNGYSSYNAISNSGLGAAASGIINPGQGFFVKATGTLPALTFDESFKATTSTTSLFKTSNANDELRMTMRSDAFNSDQFVLKFITNATSRDDKYDIKRMNNGANDVYSFGTDNIAHALDARPLSLSVTDTIKLYTGGTNGLHTFTFNTIPAATGVNFYLKDNFLNSITPIIQNGVYNFNITSSNAATFGNNRFRIIIENTNALPVTISKFIATLNNQNQAVLSWTTATEKNSKGFEVEHSLDNVNYKKLETVKAKGNSNAQVNYTYTDAGFVKGLVNYYRLKLVDIDNTYTYSGVRQLSEENTIQSAVSDYVFMAPIPTVDYVKIWSDVEVLNGGAEVKIYDTQMKLISTKTIYGFGKLNEILDLTGLEQGVYIVQIKDKNNAWMVTRKVVKN